jgi:hypothetical protein
MDLHSPLVNQQSKRHVAKERKTMSDIVTHEKDDLLRKHLLTNDQLTNAEIRYPGCIRILATGRYHARLEVEESCWNFTIIEVSTDEYRIVTNYPFDTYRPLLRELVWHRATEAMMAHRRGHFEAYRNKLLRKPQRQEERQRA